MYTSPLPLVTVITLTYNRFEGIGDTIKSVLMQGYPNIEYIIYDDGSECFPEDMIKEYVKGAADIHIQVLVQKENVGTVRNLNAAYKQATGDFIVNLSCGDVFYNRNVLSKIVDRFQSKQCDVLVTSRAVCRGGKTSLLPHFSERKLIEMKQTPYDQYSLFISGNYYDMASGSALSFRREFIQKFGYFDETYRLWEDGPFLQKFLWGNCLNFAYDIISIWYEETGISHFPNQYMLEDIRLFNLTERQTHIREMPFTVRRQLHYRAWQAKKLHPLVFRIGQAFFLLEVIKNKKYEWDRKRALQLDYSYLDSLNSE